MSDPTFMKRVKLENLLSFGPDGMELDLLPLNVIIGRNASGKSNLIHALSVLKWAPINISIPFEASGSSHWLWKGSRELPEAVIAVDLAYDSETLSHVIRFTSDQLGYIRLNDETISILDSEGLFGKGKELKPIYAFNLGQPVYKGSSFDIDTHGPDMMTPSPRSRVSQSVVSLRVERQRYPEIAYLTENYYLIRVFRGWNLGYTYSTRRMNVPGDFLLEDASNLPDVLNNLETRHADALTSIESHVRRIYPEVSRFTTLLENQRLNLYLHENALAQAVPEMRFSDGLHRYLCLLVILCHPTPPSLVCIEEPEIGLHPDAIFQVAKLLKEASERTQLIVTTHSDILVSQMTDRPEAIVVCERDESGTHMTRLEPGKLEKWLKDEYLGNLWLSGEIGGTL